MVKWKWKCSHWESVSQLSVGWGWIKIGLGGGGREQRKEHFCSSISQARKEIIITICFFPEEKYYFPERLPQLALESCLESWIVRLLKQKSWRLDNSEPQNPIKFFKKNKGRKKCLRRGERKEVSHNRKMQEGKSASAGWMLESWPQLCKERSRI